jgi:diadenosine tetraphosphate (Ap4A) HIT family hydrolase
MPLKKSTYKKPREQINSYEESTWLGNDKPFFENQHCAVFYDKYPVVPGHLLFIPKKNDPATVAEAYKLAYYCGEEWMKEEKIDGFNVGQNRGPAAGQTIYWPHIHFIPRHDGDSTEEQHNGIRNAPPNGNHIKAY